MASFDRIISCQAHPATIGGLDIVIYCDKFKAEGARAFSEKNTVNGKSIFSNSAKRAMKISIEGRVYDGERPFNIMDSLNAYIFLDSECDVEYRGITFGKCHVQSFRLEDKGGDFLSCSVTLLTAQLPVREADGNDSTNQA